MQCRICQKGNAPRFFICGACMDAICSLDAKRYGWYQNAVKQALFPPEKDGRFRTKAVPSVCRTVLFPPAEGDQLPLSLPPVSFPAILEPEVCLLRISES